MAITFIPYAIHRHGLPGQSAPDIVGTMYRLDETDVDAVLPLDPQVTLTPLMGYFRSDTPEITSWIIRSGDDSVSVFVREGWPRYVNRTAGEKLWLMRWLAARGYEPKNGDVSDNENGEETEIRYVRR